MRLKPLVEIDGADDGVDDCDDEQDYGYGREGRQGFARGEVFEFSAGGGEVHAHEFEGEVG